MDKNRTEYPEKWIMAFLTGTRVKDICKQAGISRTKYYSLRADKAFEAVLRERKDMAVKSAVEALRAHFLRDVQILQEIAENKENSAQVRVNAVSVALSQLANWTSTIDLLERLEALENAQNDDFSTFKGVS